MLHAQKHQQHGQKLRKTGLSFRETWPGIVQTQTPPLARMIGVIAAGALHLQLRASVRRDKGGLTRPLRLMIVRRRPDGN